MEVVLEDGLDHRPGRPPLLALLAPVSRLLTVEGQQQIEEHDEEVRRADGRVEGLEVADAGQGVFDRVVGDRLREVVGPAPLGVGVQRHQLGERHLARVAFRSPGGPTLLEPRERAVGLDLGCPAVLLAHRQPHRAQAVLERPLDQVPLGEHLRLAGDLVGRELAASVELGVERFPLRVVPVLVDPAERHVVGPAQAESRAVELFDHVPERRRGHGDELGDARVAVQARQLGGEVLEDEAEQEPVPLALVAPNERRGQRAEFLVVRALPPAGDDRRPTDARGFEESQEDDPVQQRVRSLLLRVPADVVRTPRRTAPATSGADLLGNPRLQAGTSGRLTFGEPGILRGDGEPVGGVGRAVEIIEQSRP